MEQATPPDELTPAARALCESLGLPGCLPLELGTTRIVETHVSVVFIGNDLVFKLKKPVDLGFCDHRTVEARWTSAVNEVRLNRRLAADVYLGVLCFPQHGSGELSLDALIPAPEILPPGTADVAVVMRRLPAESFLDVRARGDEDLRRIMRDIGSVLASFHRRAIDAARCEPIAADTVQTALADNIAAVRPKANDREGERVQQLRIIERRAARQEPFAERAARGFVVDGHGDLRCEHVSICPDVIRIIDCVEFNEALRRGDVLSDLAFLRMDLDLLHRGDLAEELLAAYRLQLPEVYDETFLAYCSMYRATVRAKISVIRESQAADEAQTRAAAAAASRFLGLACRYALDLERPFVLAIAGLMGTGKSSLARRIAALTDAAVLQSDVVRKELFGSSERDRTTEFGAGNYSDAATRETYRELFARARHNLTRRVPVIIDSSLAEGWMRAEARTIAAEHDARLTIVHCTVSRDEAHRRLRRRAEEGIDVSDGREEIADLQAARFEPFSEPDKHHLLTLDSAAPLAEQADAVLDALLTQA